MNLGIVKSVYYRYFPTESLAVMLNPAESKNLTVVAK
jgi:hypothetical protein